MATVTSTTTATTPIRAPRDYTEDPGLDAQTTIHAIPPFVSRPTAVLDVLDEKVKYGDFRDDLARDGFCVVKNVIDKEKALAYASEIHDWLEGFGLGYKRGVASTINDDCLPIIHTKGLVQAYGATHESFTWGARSEPGVIAAFEKLYQTGDLICSFDAINVSLANKSNTAPNTAWPHQDQGDSFLCLPC
jgi:hypothetical protein